MCDIFLFDFDNSCDLNTYHIAWRKGRPDQIKMDSASDRSNSPYDIDFLLNPFSSSETVQDSPTRKTTDNSPTPEEHWRYPACVAGARHTCSCVFPHRFDSPVTSARGFECAGLLADASCWSSDLFTLASSLAGASSNRLPIDFGTER